MYIFAIIGAYTFICIGVIVIFVLGPTREHRKGVLGVLHRYMSMVPRLVGVCCCLVCAKGNVGVAKAYWTKCEEHTMGSKHPALVVVYIILVWTVEGLYLWFVVPVINGGMVRKLFSYAIIVGSESLYIIACCSDPGIVTAAKDLDEQKRQHGEISIARIVKKSNDEVHVKKTNKYRHILLSSKDEKRQNEKYHFDGFLSSADPRSTVLGKECRTCKVSRPARSKHCSLCGHCVRRFDHHCPWINNDVGENNVKWFSAFLLSHWFTCMYCACESVLHIMRFLEVEKAWTADFVNNQGIRSKMSWTILFMYLIKHKLIIMLLIVFCIIIGLMLLWFWCHHTLMCIRNQTTNEQGKVDYIIEFLTSYRSLVSYKETTREMKEELVIVNKGLEGMPATSENRDKIDAMISIREDTIKMREKRTEEGHSHIAASTPAFIDDREIKKIVKEFEASEKALRSVTKDMNILKRRRQEELDIIKKRLLTTYVIANGGWLANFSDVLFPYSQRISNNSNSKALYPLKKKK
eukprot:Tbor_TRINITY_DN2505_c0_g1::TRINITY_DN2505_c0_g1_i1::g.460::m.460